jgi:uncharacterized protein YaeQ
VALPSTVHTFEIDLSDVDRGVYETLALKMARHPSETEEYFVARVLAYCLEFTEGLTFSRGLAEPDEPALSVRDLTGTLLAWIEIGQPDAARLHKASKAAPRVVVYTHKEPRHLVNQLAGERIHRADELELYAIDRALLAELTSRLERRMVLGVSIMDRHIFVSVDGVTIEGRVDRFGIVEA